MKLHPTQIPEVIEITPRIFEDDRGSFMESWHASKFADAGLGADFVQDNQSASRQGALRGLHYQLRRPQGKLVRVVVGRVFDVAVDVRRSSSTFGQWIARELTQDNQRMLWIPPGFAHGFYVTSDRAVLLYKCTDFYSPDDERTIRWDDPNLAIDWPLIEGRPPRISAKDRAGVPLVAADCLP